MTVDVQFAMVTRRFERSAVLLVCGRVDERPFAVSTDLYEGRDEPEVRPDRWERLPDRQRVGFPPAAQAPGFAVALHDALAQQCPELVRAEMERICG